MLYIKWLLSYFIMIYIYINIANDKFASIITQNLYKSIILNYIYR